MTGDTHGRKDGPLPEKLICARRAVIYLARVAKEARLESLGIFADIVIEAAGPALRSCAEGSAERLAQRSHVFQMLFERLPFGRMFRRAMGEIRSFHRVRSFLSAV